MAAARKTPPEAEIYRVDTEPPPPGEDSAYSAPTKVGPMSHAVIDKLMREAEQHGIVMPATQSGVRPAIGKEPTVEPPPRSGLKPSKGHGGQGADQRPALPVLYDYESDDESEFDPTKVNDSVQAPPAVAAGEADPNAGVVAAIVAGVMAEIVAEPVRSRSESPATSAPAVAPATAPKPPGASAAAGPIQTPAAIANARPARRPPAFPEWTAAASRYEPPPPRLSDRALALRIGAGALATLAALTALLWWLFQ
jgi:hypothetical protein